MPIDWLLSQLPNAQPKDNNNSVVCALRVMVRVIFKIHCVYRYLVAHCVRVFVDSHCSLIDNECGDECVGEPNHSEVIISSICHLYLLWLSTLTFTQGTRVRLE